MAELWPVKCDHLPPGATRPNHDLLCHFFQKTLQRLFDFCHELMQFRVVSHPILVMALGIDLEPGGQSTPQCPLLLSFARKRGGRKEGKRGGTGGGGNRGRENRGEGKKGLWLFSYGDSWFYVKKFFLTRWSFLPYVLFITRERIELESWDCFIWKAFVCRFRICLRFYFHCETS